MDQVLGSSVPVIVADGNKRPVDGQLLKVGAAVTVDLGVEIGEETPLQQRILGKVDAADDVAGLEHDLLDLGEVVGGIDVEPQHAERLQGRQLLRDDLGGVQDVEAKGRGLVLVDNLDVELPLGEVPRLDGVPEILAVVVGVLAGDVLGLVPDKAGPALLRLEVPLDQLRLAIVGDEAIRVDAKTILPSLGSELCVSPMRVHQAQEGMGVEGSIDSPCDGSFAGCHSQPWPRTRCAASSTAG